MLNHQPKNRAVFLCYYCELWTLNCLSRKIEIFFQRSPSDNFHNFSWMPEKNVTK